MTPFPEISKASGLADRAPRLAAPQQEGEPQNAAKADVFSLQAGEIFIGDALDPKEYLAGPVTPERPVMPTQDRLAAQISAAFAVSYRSEATLESDAPASASQAEKAVEPPVSPETVPLDAEAIAQAADIPPDPHAVFESVITNRMADFADSGEDAAETAVMPESREADGFTPAIAEPFVPETEARTGYEEAPAVAIAAPETKAGPTPDESGTGESKVSAASPHEAASKLTDRADPRSDADTATVSRAERQDTAAAKPASQQGSPIPSPELRAALLSEDSFLQQEKPDAAHRLASVEGADMTPAAMRDQEAAARVTDLRAAAPTLTTARPTTAEGADVVREIVQAGISARSDTRLELRLDPPELGKINIDFDFSEERISIVVRAEREEALDLMRRHSEELLRSFRSSGLDLGSLDFARGGSRQHDDQQNRSSVTGHNYATTTDTVAAPHIAVANDRLDIRI